MDTDFEGPQKAQKTQKYLFRQDNRIYKIKIML